MAEVIQTIFVTPAIAIARLGGSTKPQDAYNRSFSAAARIG